MPTITQLELDSTHPRVWNVFLKQAYLHTSVTRYTRLHTKNYLFAASNVPASSSLRQYHPETNYRIFSLKTSQNFSLMSDTAKIYQVTLKMTTVASRKTLSTHKILSWNSNPKLPPFCPKAAHYDTVNYLFIRACKFATLKLSWMHHGCGGFARVCREDYCRKCTCIVTRATEWVIKNNTDVDLFDNL